MCDVLKGEFGLHKFGFKHHNGKVFYTTQWKWPPKGFLVYRVLTAMYCVACLLALTIPTAWSNDEHPIMAFLTLWTYTLLCAYFVLTAVIVVVCWSAGKIENQLIGNVIAANHQNEAQNRKFDAGVFSIAYEKDPEAAFETEPSATNNNVIQNGGENRLSNGSHESQETIGSVEAGDIHWSMKLSWLLANVLYVFAVLVSIVYFTALFPYIGVTSGFIHDLNMHAFNSVLVFADAFIVARPVRLLHVIYPIVYGCCYLVFSVVYWSRDKESNVLYPGVLDWNYPTKTAIFVLLLCVFVIPLIQLMHFGIYRLRLRIYRRIHGHDCNF